MIGADLAIFGECFAIPASSLAGFKLLLVEDNADSLGALRQILKHHRAEIRGCA